MPLVAPRLQLVVHPAVAPTSYAAVLVNSTSGDDGSNIDTGDGPSEEDVTELAPLPPTLSSTAVIYFPLMSIHSGQLQVNRTDYRVVSAVLSTVNIMAPPHHVISMMSSLSRGMNCRSEQVSLTRYNNDTSCDYDEHDENGATTTSGSCHLTKTKMTGTVTDQLPRYFTHNTSIYFDRRIVQIIYIQIICLF